MPHWPHAPIHLLTEAGAYMVTGSTGKRFPHLYTTARLTDFQNHLFRLANDYGWELQAWAILSNHYHFVAISPRDASTLSRFVQHLHSVSAKEINADDNVRGRQVWFQYWDSRITYQRSYYARIQYVNQNPVKHGMVDNALDYEWCSASWFETTAEKAMIKMVKSFRVDRLSVDDEF